MNDDIAMKKKHSLSQEELTLFREAIPGIKRLKNDTVLHKPQKKHKFIVSSKRLIQQQVDTSYYFLDEFYFSDEFQPMLDNEGPVRHVKPNVSHFELKKLRRGDYSPELFLDLHGLTQREAKKELGALIAACQREYVHCACIMHGHGKHILKQQTPLWLAQHPDVEAFHQAPRKLGGDAALLVLIELNDKTSQR